MLCRWLQKWGLFIYAGCALAWLFGYLMDWDRLLWAGVGLALLITSLCEGCDYVATHKGIHLVIPLLTVLGLLLWVGVLLGRLL